METCESTESEHTAGKGLTAWPVLTGIQDPSMHTRAFKGHPDLETKDRLLVMAHSLGHHGDSDNRRLQKITERLLKRGMQSRST